MTGEPETGEAKPDGGGSLWPKMAGLALIVGTIWHHFDPRLWLMPDLESQPALTSVILALSNDDPDTEEVPGSREPGESMSDRMLFIAWARDAALDSSMEIPLTVGGAIAFQRERAEEAREQRRQDAVAAITARQEQVEQATQVEQAAALQRIAQEEEKRRAQETETLAEQWNTQPDHSPVKRDAGQSQQVDEARTADWEQQIRQCQEPYLRAWQTFDEHPSLEEGDAVNSARLAKDACLEELYHKAAAQ